MWLLPLLLLLLLLLLLCRAVGHDAEPCVHEHGCQPYADTSISEHVRSHSQEIQVVTYLLIPSLSLSLSLFSAGQMISRGVVPTNPGDIPPEMMLVLTTERV